MSSGVDRVIDRELQAAFADHYALQRELGRGGMAVVYLAHDRQHGRQVAIKVLRPDLRASVSGERFLREIRVTARLTHPNILPLHASGEAGGLLYFVTPFVEGESLRQRLAREGKLPIEAVVRLMREVADALDYAHRQGVVHRDIKPENILLADGHAVVADFGIARAVIRARTTNDTTGGMSTTLTRAGTTLGTPAYMAPEQALADGAADHRADLYALGVVAYEAIAGVHPFGARSSQALLAAHIAEQPAPLATHRPDVPPALAALVACLLAKDPADRPESAGAVLRALASEPVVPRGARQRLTALAAGAALLVLVAAAGYAVSRRAAAGREVASVARAGPAASATSAASGAPTAGAADVRPSIAVLPLANTSGDSADEHFSDGLTDELIGALGKVSGLKVAGRTSSFALKGRDLTVRAVADTLGVATVLEGSVRRAGGRLKVGAQLVSAGDGAVMWTETYDRELKDVFAVQEEIARAIVGALRVKLVGGGGAGGGTALVGRQTTDSAAYELYLRGRYVFNTRTEREGVLQAMELFEQAIARDPRYARAYAGLSDAHARYAVFGYGRPREQFAQAKAAAHRALALDSTLGEAHGSLAHALFVYDFDRAAAEREFRRAIELDPGYTFSRLAFAICLQDQGRFDEAIAQLDTARALDPLSSSVSNVLGRVYLSADQPDRAIEFLRAALELNPHIDFAYQQLGLAFLRKGMRAEAIAALSRAAAAAGPRDSAYLAYAYAVTGDRAEGERIVRTLRERSDPAAVLPVPMAVAYAGLGDADEAFRWLDRGYEQRASYMDGIAITPAFAALHDDPRWGRLLRRLGAQP